MTVAEKRWHTTTRHNIDACCSVLQDPEEYEKYFEKNQNPRGHWPIEGVRAFKDICLAVSYEGLGGRRCFCSWQQGLAGSREVIPPHQHPTQARGKGQRTLARVSTTEPGPSDSFSEMPPALFSRLLAENLPRQVSSCQWHFWCNRLHSKSLCVLTCSFPNGPDKTFLSSFTNDTKHELFSATLTALNSI